MRHVQYDSGGQIVSDVWTDDQGNPSTLAAELTKLENQESIKTLLRQSLPGLQTIIDTADVSFTTVPGAQASMRILQTQIRIEARQLRRLTFLSLGLLDGTD